jgi:uncharacterized protein YjbI with pentapeptide repeats
VESQRAFRSSSLGGADLRDAVLNRANLRGADLNRADLTMAMLAEADLALSNLRGVILNGAHLIKAKTGLHDCFV